MFDKIVDQFIPSDMKSISGMDAAFLYGETPTSPMHVGSVSIIEGSLEFETFKAHVASRLHLMPILRKRLMEIPFKIDYPYWVDDPDFNMDLHVHHMALPRPGGWKELRALASDIFSRHLDRNRPLWTYTYIEGLDNIPQVPKGSIAIISKMHHVAIDGVAGAGMLSVLFDPSSEVKPIGEVQPFEPDPLPNDVGLIVKSTESFIRRPFKLPKILGEAAMATMKSGFMTRAKHIKPPTAPFTAPRTPLNGIISAQRKWNSAILSLDRVKHLRKIMGCTLNDVILSICAGALRKYLLDKKKLPAQPLVAMVPISVRDGKDKSNQGNQVSAMLVQLGTNIEDPLERLEVIQENALRGKTYQGAIGANTLSNLAETIPFGLANQAARVYSRYNLSRYHNPAMNLTITNVPGPPIPLYIQGHKLITVMGMAPIIDGMGLIITVLSYNGMITLSPTSDANSMPDIDVFTRYLWESANYLESKILKMEQDIKKGKGKGVSTKPLSDALFAKVKKYLKENPESINSGIGLFQFNVTGPAQAQWKVDLRKSPGKVIRGVVADPDATFTIRDKYLSRIGTGDLDVASAFIQGRLAIKGDSDKAMKLGKLLASMPK